MMSRDLCITILWFLFRNWSLFCLLYRAVLYFLDSAAPYVNAGAATAITRLTTSDSNSSAFLHSLYTADVKPFMPSAVAQPTYRLKLVNRPQSPYIEVEFQVIDASHLKLEGPDEHDREFMKAGLLAHPGLCTDLANGLAQHERQLQDRLAARLAQRRILLNERWRALVSMTLGVLRDYDEQIHCRLRQEHAARYSCQAMNSDSLYLGGISIRMSITTFGTLPRGVYDLWAGEVTIVIGPDNERCTDLVDYVLQR